MSGDGDRVAGKEGGLRHERHSRRCGTVDSCYTLTLLKQRQKRASTDCVVSFATV